VVPYGGKLRCATTDAWGSARRLGPMSAPQMVDWDFAVSAAARLAGPGPEITRAEADAAVAEHFGDLEGYLYDGLRITQGTVESLRARLRG